MTGKEAAALLCLSLEFSLSFLEAVDSASLNDAVRQSAVDSMI